MDTETLETVEEALEEIEDGTSKLLRIARNHNLHIFAAVVLSGAAGGFIGYKLSQKKWRLHYEEISLKEIADAKAYYSRREKKDEGGEPLTPRQILEEKHGKEAIEALREYQGESSDDVSVDEEAGEGPREEVEVVVSEERRNIFSDKAPVETTWDYEVEVKIREENPDKPYVIHHDEYFEGEKDYQQASLTYFGGDNILVDERDQPIHDEETIVGSDNLTKFGHGSKDSNVVYIRNDNIEVDFEIVRSTGSYVHEVLNLDDEDEKSLKHSARAGIRRFRESDD
jgi:hypothetical protein